MTLAFPSSYHLHYLQDSAIATELDAPEYVFADNPPFSSSSSSSPSSVSSSGHERFASRTMQVHSPFVMSSNSGSRRGSSHGVHPQDLYATKLEIVESSSIGQYHSSISSQHENLYQKLFQDQSSHGVCVAAEIAMKEGRSMFQNQYSREVSVAADMAMKERKSMFRNECGHEVSPSTVMEMKERKSVFSYTAPTREVALSQTEKYQIVQDQYSPVSFADMDMTERQSVLASTSLMASCGRESHGTVSTAIFHSTTQGYDTKHEMMESSNLYHHHTHVSQPEQYHILQDQHNLADMAMKEIHGSVLPVPRQIESLQDEDFTQVKHPLTDQGKDYVVAPWQVITSSDRLYTRNLGDLDKKEKQNSMSLPLQSCTETELEDNALQVDRETIARKGSSLTVQVNQQQQGKDHQLPATWQIFCNDGYGGSTLLISPTQYCTTSEADQAAEAGFWTSIYNNYNKVDQINGVVVTADPASSSVSSPLPAEFIGVSSSETVATNYTADSARGSCSPSSSSVCILGQHSPSPSPSPSMAFQFESSSIDVAISSRSSSLPAPAIHASTENQFCLEPAEAYNYTEEKHLEQKLKVNRNLVEVPHQLGEATDHLDIYPVQYTISSAKLPSVSPLPLLATNLPDMILMATQRQKVEEGRRKEEEDLGIELIELLTACVEAISAGDLTSVNQLFARLGRLASPTGNSVQRLSAYFTEAMACRASRLWPQMYQTLPVLYTQTADLVCNTNEVGDPAAIAWQALNQVTPLVKFSQYTANEIILQAFEGEEKVHIIDLDLKQGLQWPSLFHSLATRAGGPPKLVRLTGIGECKDDVQDAGDRLAEFAEELGLRLEFHGVVDKLEDVRLWMLHVKTKEAVAVNCVLQLHRVLRDESGEEARKLLALIHSMKPKVVAMVEQEVLHDCLHEEPAMEARFAGAIRYFSALFDALQGGGQGDHTPTDCRETRLKVEEFLGAQIRNIVACEGEMRVERYQPWRRWKALLEDAGFCNQRLSHRSRVQAQLLLRMFSSSCSSKAVVAKKTSSFPSAYSYRLLPDEPDHHRLTLAWLDQTLLTASAWAPLPPPWPTQTQTQTSASASLSS